VFSFAASARAEGQTEFAADIAPRFRAEPEGAEETSQPAAVHCCGLAFASASAASCFDHDDLENSSSQQRLFDALMRTLILTLRKREGETHIEEAV
jgi:hypothetical protein